MALVKRSKCVEEKPVVPDTRRSRTVDERAEEEGYIPERRGTKRDKRKYDKAFPEDGDIPTHWFPEPCDLILTERSPAASLEIWNRLAEKGKNNLRKKVFGNITYGQVQEAIFECGGFQTNIARKLQISTHYLKQIFQKNKGLFYLYNEVRESLVDEVEMHMMNKIRSGAKESVNLIMFYLKCLGKDRGFVETVKDTGKKASVKMKIVPTSEKKKKESKEIAEKAVGNVVSFKKVGNDG